MPNKQAVSELLSDAIRSDPQATQASVAALLGVQAPTINKWTQGKTMPAFERWPEVETVLGLKAGSIESAYRKPPADRVDELERQVDTLESALLELKAMVEQMQSESQPG